METDTWYQKKLIEDVPEEELHAALIDEDFEDDEGEEDDEDEDEETSESEDATWPEDGAPEKQDVPAVAMSRKHHGAERNGL